MICWISVTVSSRGVSKSFGPCDVKCCMLSILIALGVAGNTPLRSMEWATRPVCHSCAKINPPLAWTAAVTCFHAPICAWVNKPGVSGLLRAVCIWFAAVFLVKICACCVKNARKVFNLAAFFSCIRKFFLKKPLRKPNANSPYASAEMLMASDKIKPALARWA